MSQNCLSRNPLTRDGTSQSQRLLQALLPSYVAVDERSMKDLLQFAEAYGKEIRFYDLENSGNFDWQGFYQLTDDWESFSVEQFLNQLLKYQETKPHLALFLGFLYMFKVVQADLNTITQRHLDFYYREVLQLKEQPAVADQVAVIFQLAKHVHRHEVKAGTLLKAGKDDTGVERLYRVEEDVVVNRAEVAEMRALFANIHAALPDPGGPGDSNDHRLYVSPVANSADGQGAAIETEEKSWATFGRPIIDAASGQAGRAQAEIGFAVASPILFLAEGTRKVNLKFFFEAPPPFGADDIFDVAGDPPFALRVAFSGAEEWVVPSGLGHPVVLSENGLSIEATLSQDQPAIVAFDREVLAEPLVTSWPVVKLTLNPEWKASPHLYALFKNLQIARAEIAVEVEGVRNLALQNDQGVLDPSKPFLPFGSRPYIGSNFYIGSWEVFQKQLDWIDLRFRWNELPDAVLNEDTEDEISGFDLYYRSVNADGSLNTFVGYERSNNDFKIAVSSLDKKGWEVVEPWTYLYTDSDGNPIPNKGKLLGSEELRAIDLDAFGQERDPYLPPIGKYGVEAQRGFLRLSLSNKDFGKDFGHSVFSRIYSEAAIEKAKSTTGALPNPPYTPSMQGLYLEYRSHIAFSTADAADQGVEQFFHIHPFGASEIDLSASGNYLLPHIAEEGQLFIGIRYLVPPQTLSLLMVVAEGSANPDRERQKVRWSFLAGSQWVEFDDKQILHDSTNGLLTTGIIRFDVPKAATAEHTRMPAGLHWIRAAVAEQSDAVCRLVDIRAQALFARFQDQGNDPGHQRQPLPAETIGKLLASDAAVDKVIQPYASFGGKVKEARADFYTRTSERLRHKNRAITIWDYERLILNQFPSIYKVKCVNHTRFTGTLTNYSEMAPGHVTLIIISNVQNKNAVDPLRPKTSLAVLAEIEDFIRAINPPCIQVHVRNPIYEEVRVDFKVKFHSGVDAGYYQQRLEQDIRSFLSPWASDCVADIRFGGGIHKSMVLNFVEERSYVDYVACFKMYHSVAGVEGPDTDEAVATTAISILGSADGHTVRLLDADEADCGCDDNIVKTSALRAADDCGCQDKPKN